MNRSPMPSNEYAGGGRCELQPVAGDRCIGAQYGPARTLYQRVAPSKNGKRAH